MWGSGEAATALAGLLTFVIGVLLLRRRFGDPSKFGDQHDNTRILELSPLEKSFARLPIPSISTVTFYDGECPETYLQNKVASIVKANPWLAGRFVSRNGRPVLEYTTSTTDSFFEIAAPLNISPGTPPVELGQLIAPLCVDSASKSFASDSTLFKVVCIPHAREATRFALVASVSHVIADGFTFYKLNTMLSKEVEVTALAVARKPIQKEMRELIGAEEERWVSRPPIGKLIGFVSTILFKPTPKCTMFKVDSAWIGQQKQEAKGEVSFVSTNDILTSWFLRECKCAFGLMAINFRNRIAGVTEAMGGNYEAGVIYCDASDYQTPALIRKSVQKFRRATSSKFPGFWSLLTNHCALISNWSTFYSDVHLDGCSLLWHMPIADLRTVPWRDTAVVFCPREGEIAVVAAMRSMGPQALRASICTTG